MKYELTLPVLHIAPTVKAVHITDNLDHFESKKIEQDAKEWADYLEFNCPARFVIKLKELL